MSGEVEKAWPLVPLNKCCQIVSGSTPQSNSSEYWNGDIPWITPKDLSIQKKSAIVCGGERHITEAGLASCSTKLLPVGTVLFSSRAPIGLTAIAGVPLCTNQGFKNLVPGREVDSKYLYWVMRRKSKEIDALGRGATFREISKDILGAVKIPLPPLPEQRRIAAILDKADAIRRKRQEAIRLSEQFLRSVFLEMFGDPVVNPKGYTQRSFEEITTKVFKGAFDLKKEEYQCNGIPFIRINNIQKNTIDLTSAVYISEDTYDKYANASVVPGDVVFSKVGTIDRLALVPDSIPRGVISQNNVGAKLRRDLVDPIYIATFLQLPQTISTIRRGSKKSVQDKLVLSDLRALKVLIPPLAQQRIWTTIVENVRHTRREFGTSLKRQDDLIRSLTAQLLHSTCSL